MIDIICIIWYNVLCNNNLQTKGHYTMLKSFVCFATLLIAPLAVFAHGDGDCSGRPDLWWRIGHFTPNSPDDPNVIYNPNWDNPGFDSGHGHLRYLENGTTLWNWSYKSAGGYERVKNDLSNFYDCPDFSDGNTTNPMENPSTHVVSPPQPQPQPQPQPSHNRNHNRNRNLMFRRP